jgi:hypothetical protein
MHALAQVRGSQNDAELKEEISHVLVSLYVVKAILGITDEDIEHEAIRKCQKYGWVNCDKDDEEFSECGVSCCLDCGTALNIQEE